jgi:hypothetical protein
MRPSGKTVVAISFLCLTGLLATPLVCAAGAPIGQSPHPVKITLAEQGRPLAEAQVTIILSDMAMTAKTDQDGFVSFPVEIGRKGFWLEVNGQRLDEFFFVRNNPFTLDVSAIGYMDWPGR